MAISTACPRLGFIVIDNMDTAKKYVQLLKAKSGNGHFSGSGQDSSSVVVVVILSLQPFLKCYKYLSAHQKFRVNHTINLTSKKTSYCWNSSSLHESRFFVFPFVAFFHAVSLFLFLFENDWSVFLIPDFDKEACFSQMTDCPGLTLPPGMVHFPISEMQFLIADRDKEACFSQMTDCPGLTLPPGMVHFPNSEIQFLIADRDKKACFSQMTDYPGLTLPPGMVHFPISEI